MNKQLLVNAVIGVSFKSYLFAGEMTKKRLAVFSGNQWNENWRWERTALEKLSEDKLMEIYNLAISQ